MPNEGLQGTNDIAQVAKSLVPRSIKTCLCTPIKFCQHDLDMIHIHYTNSEISHLALQVNVSNIYEVVMIAVLPGDNTYIYT